MKRIAAVVFVFCVSAGWLGSLQAKEPSAERNMQAVRLIPVESDDSEPLSKFYVAKDGEHLTPIERRLMQADFCEIGEQSLMMRNCATEPFLTF